ncbi:hypothetical protein [Spirochaeta thermophila]|uniref:Uncharacterized protein n=1 Tax=Winmispira thermophila (strain ATCC 49972 / DSM 6192 / RI 19.B1) TaxID=665571 RepID=E0RT76_WINT6|nr:hypothetical protein [Spirochaeta thermophila]ADN02372.1 hypothetical protein STHERM_c14320 [Spirochaeta thermophila DSM 6192]
MRRSMLAGGLLLLLLFSGCERLERRSEEPAATGGEPVASAQAEGVPSRDIPREEAPAVVLEAVSIWDSLDKGKKSLATATVGERLTFLGEIKEGVSSSGNKLEYALVRLSDGTQGWAYTGYLALRATLGVITKKVDYYQRPTTLLPSGQLEPFTLIGIGEKKEEGRQQIYFFETSRNVVREAWVMEGFSDRDVDLRLTARYFLILRDEDLPPEERYQKILELAQESQAEPVSADLVDSLQVKLDELSQELAEEAEETPTPEPSPETTASSM